jgi:LacI family transcriptional regulator
MKRLTIRDVAAEAGVSIATVSRVLTPERGEKVSEKTRKRVDSAVEKMGYRANYTARSLKTRSTRTVAIIAPELTNDFFMGIAEGMERELDAQGYTLLIASSARSVEEEKKRISMLADRMVDGMVVIPVGSQGEHLAAAANLGFPIVLVDRLVEGADLDAVLSDNEPGAFELTKRLLKDGFRRVAFVGGDITVSSARERLSGFARALAEADIKPEPDWIRLGGMSVEDGYRCMDVILRSRRPPEALVAVNLLVHIGMQRRLQEDRVDAKLYGQAAGQGKKPGPGKGVSGASMVIAAFDETSYTPFLPACRYTAAQDAAAIGRTAAKRTLECIELRKQSEKNAVCGSGTGFPVTDPEKAGKRIIRLPVKILRH